MTTITAIISTATTLLSDTGVDSPRLDAELLLSHVLGKERRWLWTYPNTPVNDGEEHAFQALLQRRLRREPLAYLLGEWEFYGRKFYVSPAVLIPRPETELLVEAVLAEVTIRNATSVVDIGVGSGAIAVTLALEHSSLEIIATDLSAEALTVAQHNAERHGVEQRIHWAQGDLLDPLLSSAHAPFDIVVANLPYIAEEEMEQLMPEVGLYEPQMALRAGDAGMALINRLIAQAPLILSSSGLLALEIGYNQSIYVCALLSQLQWRDIRIIEDYAGIPRHIVACVPS